MTTPLDPCPLCSAAMLDHRNTDASPHWQHPDNDCLLSGFKVSDVERERAKWNRRDGAGVIAAITEPRVFDALVAYEKEIRADSSARYRAMKAALSTFLSALAPPSSAGGEQTVGWIEWHGGQCPVDPLRDGVTVKFRTGATITNASPHQAADWTWGHSGGDGDIVAYRLAAAPPSPLPDQGDGLDRNEIEGLIEHLMENNGLDPADGCEALEDDLCSAVGCQSCGCLIHKWQRVTGTLPAHSADQPGETTL